mmetsp:Transcript_98401/g.261456  ORF Transcript_98401/g.261456 Transcript_98401/m.261456 type:complete len:312 (+) Transcript_98401:1415-2350(+)
MVGHHNVCLRGCVHPAVQLWRLGRHRSTVGSYRQACDTKTLQVRQNCARNVHDVTDAHRPRRLAAKAAIHLPREVKTCQKELGCHILGLDVEGRSIPCNVALLSGGAEVCQLLCRRACERILKPVVQRRGGARRIWAWAMQVPVHEPRVRRVLERRARPVCSHLCRCGGSQRVVLMHVGVVHAIYVVSVPDVVVVHEHDVHGVDAREPALRSADAWRLPCPVLPGAPVDQIVAVDGGSASRGVLQATRPRSSQHRFAPHLCPRSIPRGVVVGCGQLADGRGRELAAPAPAERVGAVRRGGRAGRRLVELQD